MKRRRSLLPRFRRAIRRRGEGRHWLPAILLGVGAALFLIHHFDAALRPQLVALAQAQLRNQLTHIADQTVLQALSDQGLSYQDLVTLQTDPSGELATFTTDTVQLNRFRSSVMDQIVCQVEALDSHSLGVPLGALTGVDLFAAVGPALPIRVYSVAFAEGSYRNDFTSAGINQTLHRIILDVTVSASLLLPGGIENVELTVPVYITETVIIGQVPQSYLPFNQ